jgi:septal ring factor EnvC (AmiA/AmiB activator)
MLPRHKKALSDIKSAEKKLKDTLTKYTKTREVLAKVRKDVADARARLAAAHDLLES